MKTTVYPHTPERPTRASGSSKLSESGYAQVSTGPRSRLLARPACPKLVQKGIRAAELYFPQLVQLALIAKAFLQVCLLLVVKELLKCRKRMVCTTCDADRGSARAALARAGFLKHSSAGARAGTKEGAGEGASALCGEGSRVAPDGVPIPRGFFFDESSRFFRTGPAREFAPRSRHNGLRRAIAVLVILLLSGCLSVPRDREPPFYASKELFVACEAADVGTTLYALHLGALEMNPFGLWIILGLKAIVTYNRYRLDKQINEEGGGIVLNVIACSPIPNNVNVIKQLR